MADTTHLGLPLIAASQSQKHVTHNAALVRLDALVSLSVVDSVHTAPPGTPAEGDRYKVASGAVGAWSGWDLNVALFTDGQWTKLVPRKGWFCFDEATGAMTVWTGSAWTDIGVAAGFLSFTTAGNGSLPKLGILTAADATNRLAVKSNAVLLSHDDVTPGTGDMRVTLNKSAAGKDVGFTFQDAWSTRALFGLLGDDNFHVKVSPDGSVFTDAIQIDKTTGNIGIKTAPSTGANVLQVAGSNALFSNGAGGFSFTFSKNATPSDAALYFQTNFSTRALLGLLGVDDVTLKVTPDASNYYAGLRAWNALHGRLDTKDARRKQPIFWSPRPGTTTLDQAGLTAVVSGTATAVSPSAGNLFLSSPRLDIVSAAAAGAVAGANGNALFLWRGNGSSLGGFYLLLRFGIEWFQSTCRLFAGLYSSAAAIGNVNPSTLLNIVGVGFDSSDTTLSLITNDGTGTATKTSLGAGFPTTGGQDLYELILSAEPNGSEIRYRVERLNSGDVASGTITTDLPVNTQFLTPHLWFNTGTATSAVNVALFQMYCEPAALLGSRGTL